MKKPLFVINRYYEDDYQTLSANYLLNEKNQIIFNSLSLERPYRDNKQRVSAVPVGLYSAIFEYSPKFDDFLFELKKVKNRAEIKIHPANFSYQLKGCIALGKEIKPVKGSEFLKLTSSKATFEIFMNCLKDINEIQVLIINSVVKNR